MNFRLGFYAGLLLAVIWAVYLVQLWQPEHQIELHSRHLVEQIEKKNWKQTGEFIALNYHDQWGHDRAVVLERLREVSRALLNARIERTQETMRAEGNRGYWSAKITLKATGEFADYIAGRINTLDAPFELEWQRGATWPWDWKLVAVRNPALEISDEMR
jgi:hypothetical protein